MICELCSIRTQECNPLQKQHLEMIKNIDAGNAAKSNDNKCICVQCEQMLIGKYETKLQQEAEQEKLQMQLEKEKLKETLKNLKNDLDNTPNSSSNCSFSGNCHKTEVKIEKSETMDIEEISWNDNTTMEICNSTERCYDKEELNAQIDIPSGYCHETNITIEKSEIIDIEEFSWEDKKKMQILNSVDGWHDQEELNLLEQLDSKESERDKDANITRPHKRTNWSSLIKKVDDYFYCGICGETSIKYAARRTVVIHIKINHIGYRFTCTECERYFTNRTSLKEHYKKIHNISNGKITFEKAIEQHENPAEITKGNCLKNNFKKLDNFFHCSSSCTSSGNCQETNITIEKSETIDIEEFSWEDKKKMEILSSVDCWHDQEELNLLDQLDSKESECDNDANITRPHKRTNLSSLIKKVDDYFYCGICGETSIKYAVKRSVVGHIKINHIGYRFTCTECERYFTNRRNLKEHYKKIHNISNGQTTFEKAIEQNYQPVGTNKKVCLENSFKKIGNSYQCTLCSVSKKYTSRTDIRYHIQAVHLSNTAESPTIFEPQEEDDLSSLIKKLDDGFYCGICGERSNKYAAKAAVVGHIKINHIGYRFTCTECKGYFTRKISLEEHYKRKHNIRNGLIAFEKVIEENYKPIDTTKRNCVENKKILSLIKKLDDKFYCGICGERSHKFTYRSGAVRHIKIEHIGYRFTCTECKRHYTDRRPLKEHYKIIHSITNGLMSFEKVIEQHETPADITKEKCLKNNFKKIDNFSHCSSSFSSSENCHETNITIEKSEIIDIEEFSWEDKKKMDILSSVDCWHDQEELYLPDQLDSKESECDNDANINRPHKRTIFSSLIKKVDDYFYCGICGETSIKYASRRSVVGHIKINHIGYRFTCTECKRHYTDRRRLKEHYKKIHNISNGQTTFEKAIEQNDQPVDTNKNNFKKIGNSYHCTLCSVSKKYTSRNGIRYHIQTCHK